MSTFASRKILNKAENIRMRILVLFGYSENLGRIMEDRNQPEK